MLPTASKGRQASTSRANSIPFQYFRRIIKWQQMDIEYTFWQMLHLCSSPKIVFCDFRFFQFVHHENVCVAILVVVLHIPFLYHEARVSSLLSSETKNQWARDDPAFVVSCSFLSIVAASAYCVAYATTVSHAVFTIFSVLLLHFLFTAAAMATFCWSLSNSYLLEEILNSHVVEQRVEWLYAFDVHFNAFFPTFILLYVIQYFVAPLLVAHGFLPTLLLNLLYMVAFSYYHYLNFLGYDVLPFLDKTTFFLYPIGAIIILSPMMTLAGFNPTRYLLSLYFG